MTTAVIGATGRVGSEIVRGLLARGDAVTALVRDPGKARRAFGEPGGLRIRERVSVRIRDRFSGDETVTCVIPGHGQVGEELVTDQLVVDDGALAFSYSGVCGYGSRFDYAG